MRIRRILESLGFSKQMSDRQFKSFVTAVAEDIVDSGEHLSLQEANEFDQIAQSIQSVTASRGRPVVRYSWLGIDDLADVSNIDSEFESDFCYVLDSNRGSDIIDELILPAVILIENSSEASDVYRVCETLYEHSILGNVEVCANDRIECHVDSQVNFRLITPVYIQHGSSKKFSGRHSNPFRPRATGKKLSKTYTEVNVSSYKPTAAEEFAVLDRWWQFGTIQDSIYEAQISTPIKDKFWKVVHISDDYSQIILAAQKSDNPKHMVLVFLDRDKKQKAVFDYRYESFNIDDFAAGGVNVKFIHTLSSTYRTLNDLDIKDALDSAYSSFSFRGRTVERPRNIPGIGPYALPSDVEKKRRRELGSDFTQGFRIRKT